MLFFPWLLRTLRRAAWAPILVFGIHVLTARVLGLYRPAEELDLFGRPSLIVYVVTVLALTCSTTVFWEFAEFLTDRFFGTHMQNGLEDTLGDMLVGLLGGLAFVATRSVWRSPGAPPQP